MRKIRELLRLKYELGRSHREIAASLGIANSTVSDYASRAAAAGLSWPLPEGLDAPRWRRRCSRACRRRGMSGPSPTGSTCTGSFSATRASRCGCCGWSTGRCIRTATSTAGSATATGRGGGTSTWSCGRSSGPARRRSWTTRGRSSRSWTGAPARYATPWSSSVSSAPRTTRSWT